MLFSNEEVIILKDYPFIDSIKNEAGNLKGSKGFLRGIANEGAFKGCYIVVPYNISVDYIYCNRDEIMTFSECYRKLVKLEKEKNKEYMADKEDINKSPKFAIGDIVKYKKGRCKWIIMYINNNGIKGYSYHLRHDYGLGIAEYSVPESKLELVSEEETDDQNINNNL